MYTRVISKSPENLIKDGKAIFGSYDEPPKSLNIKGVKYPFGVLPMPLFITNLRIRSNLSFVFSTPEFIGTIDFLDAKFFGFSEINIWNKQTQQKFSYRGLMGLHRRLVPKNLEKAISATYSKKRYIRIAWDKAKNRFSLVFHMKGDSVRPFFTGSFTSSYNDNTKTLTTVLPAPIMRRCYVSYQRPMELQGGLCMSKEDINPFFLPQKSFALLTSTRAYYKIRVVNEHATGVGEIGNDQVYFRLTDTSLAPVDEDTYNENALFVNNELTPLPPVKITHPYGMMKKWVIQDTESMIDLTFTPISDSQRLVSVVFLHAQSHCIYGTFEGVLITKDGKSIQIKDFPGIIKNQRIRL